MSFPLHELLRLFVQCVDDLRIPRKRHERGSTVSGNHKADFIIRAFGATRQRSNLNSAAERATSPRTALALMQEDGRQRCRYRCCLLRGARGGLDTRHKVQARGGEYAARTLLVCSIASIVPVYTESASISSKISRQPTPWSRIPFSFLSRIIFDSCDSTTSCGRLMSLATCVICRNTRASENRTVVQGTRRRSFW